MFEDRKETGKLLAKQLISFSNDKNAIILGITRGGVVVAKAIADKLKLPLEIIVIKKISLPEEEELAIGAVGPKGIVYWNTNLGKKLKIAPFKMPKLIAKKQEEQEQQEKDLRGKKSAISLKDKTIILVDDGVATGASAICSSLYLKKEGAKRKILATPVIAKDTLNRIKIYFEYIVALSIKEEFYAVGQFYKKFPQVADEEIKKILRGSLV